MPDPPEKPPFLPVSEEAEGRNWTPIILGAALVVALIATFILFGRWSSSRDANTADPYLNKLQLTGLHMSTAHNFAGGSVTYIEGTITNSGDRKVNSARLLVTFRNSLDEI